MHRKYFSICGTALAKYCVPVQFLAVNVVRVATNSRNSEDDVYIERIERASWPEFKKMLRLFLHQREFLRLPVCGPA